MGKTAGFAPFRRASVIPGFGLAFGFTVTYLGLVVLIPLGALLLRSAGVGWSGFVATAFDPRTLAAMRLTFGASFAAATINAVFGVLLAWVLVRYRFPGRRLVDAAIDLPFALPTAVAGLTLAGLYSRNGWVGELLTPLGIKVAYTPLGVVVALTFVALPFMVRTVQPVIEEIDREYEEAAATLGATRLQTVVRVILPSLVPAMLTGYALSFARAIGEYGSVIFIAGNQPYVSEIVPLLIVFRLEEFNYPAATAIATLMLLISFAILLAINLVQTWSRRRFGHVA
ncbi:sulfate ABC transporter permease subunit CysT [Aureimonas leprariae]|uniref:Sulfate transport system permease protein CysT n=1 Tax=Plantimonas leprariae TaxID=2615207 RepID=A0A7V7PMY8_9HYPH|nr:sulfate ABC transporter permease subunit CysT [Aureimonas leprariae]KAB0678825.1 sulfate ABC transporter permease subunit CysT [Aureimonas leprariae]